MPNPGSFLGMRKAFLEEQSNAYAAAMADGTANDLVSDIQRRYFKRFPITLKHNVEPSQEWLDQVDDSAPDADIPIPSTDLPLEEFQRASLIYDAQLEEIKQRKDQIKRRLHYVYVKARDANAAFEKNSTDGLSVLRAKLTGISLTKPRKKTPANVWGPENRALVDPIFKSRVTEGAIPSSQHLKIRSAIYKELFEQLPGNEQAEWQQRADSEHAAIVKAQADALNSPPSTSPSDRQSVIVTIPKTVQPILDLIADYTGWKVTLIMGGPEPADGGRLNMISVHSGIMPGSVKADFGTSERAAYKERIIPTFGAFLKKCYPIEECRARALPPNHQEVHLSTMAVEEDVQVHRFDRDYEHIRLASSKVHPLIARSQAAAASKAAASSNSARKNTAPAASSSAPSTVKIGPPRGQKKSAERRIPPVGAKDKALAPPPTNPATAAAKASPEPGIDGAQTSAAAGHTSPATNSGSLTASVGAASLAAAAPVAAIGNAVSEPANTPSEPANTPSEPANTPSEPANAAAFDPSAGTGGKSSSVTTADSNTAPAPDDGGKPASAVVFTSSSANEGGSAAATSMNAAANTNLSQGRTPTPVPSRATTPVPSRAPTPAPSRAPTPAPSTANGDANLSNSSEHACAPGAAVVPNNEELDAMAMSKAKKRRATTEAGPTKPKRTKAVGVDSERTSPAFTIDIPDGMPPWVASAVEMITSTNLGSKWENLVAAWVEFEGKGGFRKEGDALPSRGRPQIISAWIKWARKSSFRGDIGPTSNFEASFSAWWTGLQPEWRAINGVEGLRRGEGDWSNIRKPGINGMLSVVAALFFWGTAVVDDAESQERWLLSADDVLYVLTELNRTA